MGGHTAGEAPGTDRDVGCSMAGEDGLKRK
jgi:hypothetical protein